jgi:hypothetical protein
MSSTSTSGGPVPKWCTASAPDAVARTEKPSRCSASRTTPRKLVVVSQIPATVGSTWPKA